MKPPTNVTPVGIVLAIRFVKAERAVDSIQVNEMDISYLTSMPDVMILLFGHRVCPRKDGPIAKFDKRHPIGAWIKTDDKDEWVAANEADFRKKMLLMIEFQEALIKKEFQDAIVRTNSWKLSFGPRNANQANDKAAADKEEVY